MKQNMFLIKEKPHNVVEKPTHRAGNKMWENWMEKEMEIFPNFILEKKQKSTIFEFIINPKNGQPILEHDNRFYLHYLFVAKNQSNRHYNPKIYSFLYDYITRYKSKSSN